MCKVSQTFNLEASPHILLIFDETPDRLNLLLSERASLKTKRQLRRRYNFVIKLPCQRIHIKLLHYQCHASFQLHVQKISASKCYRSVCTLSARSADRQVGIW
jgi:hypothetical protein